MAQSTHKVTDPQSTYDVVELVGTSTESWEDAAKNVIEQAGKHLRELRVAGVVAKDMVVRDGKVEFYRTRSMTPSHTKAMAENSAFAVSPQHQDNGASPEKMLIHLEGAHASWVSIFGKVEHLLGFQPPPEKFHFNSSNSDVL